MTEAVRAILAELRRNRGDASPPIDEAGIVREAESRMLARDAAGLRAVVNATGIVVHTNLGRAPLADEAVAAVVAVAGAYSNLEYDLAAGERGSRHDHIRELVREATGAPDAMVVNNNAAAVLLALNTLAEGREVIVSRGELVEIGGSFRIPDIMAKSGCRLVEVGTTNKTHPDDYRDAVNERTALFLKVHRSNFRMEGFTAEVGARELVVIGGEMGIPVLEDLGSGCLVDPAGLGIGAEPTVREALAAGCRLVTISGDKLLGGPQAGIIAGDAEAVAACRANPLARALRVDKMTIAALDATLRLYRDAGRAVARVPVLRMASATPESLRRKAVRWVRRWRRTLGDAAAIEVVATRTRIGGGALPGSDLPGFAVSVRPRAMSVTALAERLRAANPPVVARVSDERVLFEARTILDGEDTAVENALVAILRSSDKP